MTDRLVSEVFIETDSHYQDVLTDRIGSNTEN